MLSDAKRQVRIIKQSERNLTLLKTQTPPPASQTPAQLQRQMVSTIVSWIDDRKQAQANYPSLALLNTR